MPHVLRAGVNQKLISNELNQIKPVCFVAYIKAVVPVFDRIGCVPLKKFFMITERCEAWERTPLEKRAGQVDRAIQQNSRMNQTIPKIIRYER